jgi:peptide deformylase
VAVLPIRQFGDPVLRQRARPVERVGDAQRALIANMLDTMRAAPGVGLAGPQVGVLERIFVWEVDERHGALIDPAIEECSTATVVMDEGCLSLPGLTYPVERAEWVTVSGRDENGQPVTLEAEGLLARVCQHEIDHLDGVLFVDRLPEALKQEALGVLRSQMLGLATPAGHARDAL